MHLATLALTLSTIANPSTLANVPAVMTAPAAATTVANAAVDDRASTDPAVAIVVTQKKHRPASEPPGYPLDAEHVYSLIQAIPRSGDGGG